MRSYKILEDKARRYNNDRQIQALLRRIVNDNTKLERLTASYSKANAKALLDTDFNRQKLAARSLPYEELDQLVFDLLMGAR